jgi:HK97 family phage major capsid protein
MTIKQLEEKRATLLATAREQAEADNGDLAVVKSSMAEAKNIAERIDAMKSLGNLAPEPVVASDAKPWKNVDLPMNPFRGATSEERSYKAYAFGKLLQHLTGNQSATKWLESNGFKAMGIGTDSAGGFTVPDIVNGLIYLREEFGTIRKKCRHVVMTSDVLKVPNASTSTTAYYPNEGAAITASDLVLTQITLTAKKLAGVTIHSSELREDAIIDIASLIAKDLAFSIEKEIENALFNGDGTATFGGITGLLRAVWGLEALVANKGNIAGLVLADAGTVASGLPTLANWRAMVSRAPTYARNLEWYMHKSVFFDAIGTRLDALGGNAMGDIMNAYGANPTFYGYPVNFIQNAPSAINTANTPYAVLADLNMGAYYGDKRDLRVDVSDHIKFLEDSTTFRATTRFGFNAYDVGNTNAALASRKAGSILVLATQAT